MPVPSSSSPFDLTSMETTEWITLFTSCGMVTLPLSTAAPGAALLSWMVTLGLPLPLPLLSASAVTPAPMAPPTSAATIATGSQARNLPGVPRPAPGGVAAGVGGVTRRRVREGDRRRGDRCGWSGVDGRRCPRAGRGRRVRRARAGRCDGGGSGLRGVARGRGRCTCLPCFPAGLRHRLRGGGLRRRRARGLDGCRCLLGGGRGGCFGCAGRGIRPWLLGVLAHVDPPEGDVTYPHRCTVRWPVPAAPAVQRTSDAMLRDVDRGLASGRGARRGSVSAACHGASTLN